MNRRWLINIVLVATVLILAALVLFRPGIEKPAQKDRISTIADSEISRMIIEVARTAPIVLERKDENTWYMQKPRPGRTNPFLVSGALRVIRAQSEHRLPDDAMTNLARYGLAAPRAKVRFDKHILLFGDTNPVNNQQYVLFDNTVHMIDHRYMMAVARNHTDFLSKQLVESGRRPVKLTLPGLTLGLANGSWRATPAPATLPADRVKQLVDDWQHAQALFVKPYEKKRAESWVTMKFALKEKGGKDTSLRIGILSTSPELVLYRPDEGLQYHFPQDLKKRLFTLEK
jgi:hypothetical protein